MNVDLLLLELALERLGDLVVLGGDQSRQHLDQRHLGADRGEEAGELGAHDPAPEHRQAPGLTREVQRFLARHHALAVELEARRHRGDGSGRDHDVVGGQLDALSAGLGDPDAVGAREARRTAEDLDLSPREQGLHAAGQLLHDLVLALDQPVPAHLRLADIDAELARPADLVEKMSGDDPGLSGNAAPVETRAAELVLLDHRGLEAELRGADRRDVAAGAGADDDQVEVVGVTHDGRSRLDVACYVPLRKCPGIGTMQAGTRL